MKKATILVAYAVVFLIGCEKERDVQPVVPFSCSEFASALIERDIEKAEAEISRVLGKLNLDKGHEENLNTLLVEIDKCSDLEVVSACFECIETNPAQTEIIIAISTNGQVNNIVVDLQLKDNKFIVANIHD